MMVYIPEMKIFLKAVEGDGSNLLPEDEEEGLVDYVYIETYVWDGDELIEDDGGMLMLTEYFCDKYTDDNDKEMINDVMEYMFNGNRYEYVEIETIIK